MVKSLLADARVKRDWKLYFLRRSIAQAWEIFLARMGMMDPCNISVEGFLEQPDRALLSRWARRVPRHGVIVEIGSYCGLSSIIMALSNRRCQLHCIDPGDGRGEPESIERYARVLTPGDTFVRNIRLYGTKNVRHFRMTSTAAAKLWHGSIDLLFVDGDHSYEAVSSDVSTWSKYVCEGGILILHDATEENGWPGPQRLAKELFESGRWTFVESAGAAIVARKVHPSV